MLSYKKDKENEITISIIAANIYTFLLIVPIIIILIILFFYNKNVLDVFVKELSFLMAGVLMVSMFFLIIIHELLHAVILMIFCENKYKSIKIGFKKEYMTPYCHCKEWLYRWQYILGLLAPFIFLGLIPCIVSFIINNFILFLISQFGIIGAGGDIIISILVSLKVPAKSLVKDHPEKVGCTYKVNY